MKVGDLVSTVFLAGLFLLGLGLEAPAWSQGIYAYPAAGQSQEQQARDHGECDLWAKQQSGYNPNAPQYQPPPPAYSAPPPQSQGLLGLGDGGMFRGRGMLGDAATGAALGAAGGAIAGDAGKGAAIGALGGALIGGVRRSQRAQQQEAWYRQQQQQQAYNQQQAAQQQQRGFDEYRRAFAACMTARNYTVN